MNVLGGQGGREVRPARPAYSPYPESQRAQGESPSTTSPLWSPHGSPGSPFPAGASPSRPAHSPQEGPSCSLPPNTHPGHTLCWLGAWPCLAHFSAIPGRWAGTVAVAPSQGCSEDRETGKPRPASSAAPAAAQPPLLSLPTGLTRFSSTSCQAAPRHRPAGPSLPRAVPSRVPPLPHPRLGPRPSPQGPAAVDVGHDRGPVICQLSVPLQKFVKGSLVAGETRSGTWGTSPNIGVTAASPGLGALFPKRDPYSPARAGP